MTSEDGLWIVYAVAAIESSFARLCGPAKAALVPSLVPPDGLASANGLNAVADNLARLVGSPLGGLAIQIVGLTGVVAIDAATYVLSSVVIAGIRPAERETAGASEPATDRSPGPVDSRLRVGVKAAWINGFRTIAADRRIATVLGIAALSQLAQGIFVVLFLVFVIERLGGGGAEVGLIRGVQAIGGVLGGLAVPWLSRRVDARGLIGWGFIAFGAIALTTWNLPAITVALGFYLGLFIAAGIPGVVTSAGLMTTVQQLTPPTHLGRVFATYEAGASIFAAIGVLCAGALADQLGVVTILNAQGLIYVACGILALVPAPWPSRSADRTAGVDGSSANRRHRVRLGEKGCHSVRDATVLRLGTADQDALEDSGQRRARFGVHPEAQADPRIAGRPRILAVCAICLGDGVQGGNDLACRGVKRQAAPRHSLAVSEGGFDCVSPTQVVEVHEDLFLDDPRVATGRCANHRPFNGETHGVRRSGGFVVGHSDAEGADSLAGHDVERVHEARLAGRVRAVVIPEAAGSAG